MSIQTIPITDRQVKYSTAIWDFDTDGGNVGDFVKVYPKINKSIPENAVIVSILVENIKAIASGVLVVRIWAGADQISDSINAGIAVDDLNEVNQPTLFVKKINGGYVGLDWLGDPTSGSLVITVGYLESIANIV